VKAWVREKLKRVNELYPEERLEKSRARWSAAWAGEQPKDRYPYVFVPLTFNYYNAVMSKEDGLGAYLDEWIYRGFVQDDFIPAFFPGCKQSAIPSMFGAREIVLGSDYTCERILGAPADIDSLRPPSLIPGSPACQWLEMERYYLDECEGEAPIHVCDMQGPMDVCGQLWGYENLFLCAYDDEERYHRLMGLATDAFCALWGAQAELLGENFVGTHLFGWDWVPQGNGASLSADSMAMMSADFFDEYYAPHLKKIAGLFGGLSVHSCGNFGAVLKSLNGIEGVKAVNASQMTVGELLAAGWGADKMMILQEDAGRAEEVFSLARENRLRLDVTFTGLWPIGNGATIHPSAWTPAMRAAVAEKAAKIGELAAAG
jgi:hypothetical protein